MRSQVRSLTKRVLGGAALVGISLLMALAGCEEPEEKVFDLESPGVDVEIFKDDGDSKGRTVEIETEAEREN